MIKRLIITIVTILSLTTYVNAHNWYPPNCCNGSDCHPIPCEDIVENEKGYTYNGMQFTPSQTKPTQDKQCHACWSEPNAYNPNKTPHCLFIQPSV